MSAMGAAGAAGRARLAASAASHNKALGSSAGMDSTLERARAQRAAGALGSGGGSENSSQKGTSSPAGALPSGSGATEAGTSTGGTSTNKGGTQQGGNQKPTATPAGAPNTKTGTQPQGAGAPQGTAGAPKAQGSSSGDDVVSGSPAGNLQANNGQGSESNGSSGTLSGGTGAALAGGMAAGSLAAGSTGNKQGGLRRKAQQKMSDMRNGMSDMRNGEKRGAQREGAPQHQARDAYNKAESNFQQAKARADHAKANDVPGPQREAADLNLQSARQARDEAYAAYDQERMGHAHAYLDAQETHSTNQAALMESSNQRNAIGLTMGTESPAYAEAQQKVAANQKAVKESAAQLKSAKANFEGSHSTDKGERAKHLSGGDKARIAATQGADKFINGSQGSRSNKERGDSQAMTQGSFEAGLDYDAAEKQKAAKASAPAAGAKSADTPAPSATEEAPEKEPVGKAEASPQGGSGGEAAERKEKSIKAVRNANAQNATPQGRKAALGEIESAKNLESHGRRLMRQASSEQEAANASFQAEHGRAPSREEMMSMPGSEQRQALYAQGQSLRQQAETIHTEARESDPDGYKAAAQQQYVGRMRAIQNRGIKEGKSPEQIKEAMISQTTDTDRAHFGEKRLGQLQDMAQKPKKEKVVS